MKSSKMFATDALMSVAQTLPSTLMVENVNEDKGVFTILLLLRLTEEQSQKLKEECTKAETLLVFYTIPATYLGKLPPREIEDYSNFNFGIVRNILFNGGTPPLNSEQKYISVTIVTRN